MAETIRSDSDTARTIFYVVAVLMAIYGLGLLLFPQAIFTLSDDPGVPANPGWVRWAGGFVLGTAVAAWLAASNPENQWPVLSENHIRTYWWCSPARMEMVAMAPDRWTARCKGASFPNAKWVRA